jgi:NAD(P)-dependent dehydrogenase (short-subunit alcohol dehydrogenase family)
MNSQVALITGANKGIGFETARQLGARGYTILLGARDRQRGADAAARIPGALPILLDLEDPGTATAAAREIERSHGRLDVLVNNAGTVDWADGLPGAADLAVVRRTFETNFFGSLAVSQAMLPLLRKSAAARIVNVSSTLGSLKFQGAPDNPYKGFQTIGYAGSKAALNMLTVLLHVELRGTPAKVNSACPGYVASPLRAAHGGAGRGHHRSPRDARCQWPQRRLLRRQRAHPLVGAGRAPQ